MAFGRKVGDWTVLASAVLGLVGPELAGGYKVDLEQPSI